VRNCSKAESFPRNSNFRRKFVYNNVGTSNKYAYFAEAGGNMINSLFTKEWLADAQILCYRFSMTDKTTVDAWAEDLEQELLNWPADRTWRLLLDITLQGNIPSAYAIAQSRRLASLRPELPGRLGVLISSRLGAQIASFALRTLTNSYRQRQVFANEASARAWLLEMSSIPMSEHPKSA
jgi:hypothetical protein